mgnify:CR=1 FL=1
MKRARIRIMKRQTTVIETIKMFYAALHCNISLDNNKYVRRFKTQL